MSHHSHHHSSLVSSDLLWEITKNQNAFIVKRTSAGGVRFSRDPLNLVNIHSRKHAGFLNEKAIGVFPAEGDKGGVTLVTKKTKHAQRPGSHSHSTTFGANKSTRKTYKAIVNSTAKSGYRADLRSEAVSRASAIRLSQRPVKAEHKGKLRGAKARKAAEEGKKEE